MSSTGRARTVAIATCGETSRRTTAGTRQACAALRASSQLWAVRSQVWLEQRVLGSGRPDRGDVPGWVLVTLMTAGIVTALWVLAEPLLEGLFQRAVNDVNN